MNRTKPAVRGEDRIGASKMMGFPISQTVEEVRCLSKYARLVPSNQCIIEVGTRNGGSALVLAMSSRCPVYTIDILPDPRFSKAGYGHIPPLPKHWGNFPCGDRIHFTCCTSWEYEHKGPPVGLVFIDGGHEYEEIEKDWNHFWPMLEDDGYMLVHDYAVFDGVTNFIDGLNRTKYWPCDLVGSIIVYEKRADVTRNVRNFRVSDQPKP